MQPIVNGLEAEFGDQMAFERRDANRAEGRAVMDVYGIRGHPSYIIVSPDGEALWSYTGVMAENVLRDQIVQNLRAGE